MPRTPCSLGVKDGANGLHSQNWKKKPNQLLSPFVPYNVLECPAFPFY